MSRSALEFTPPSAPCCSSLPRGSLAARASSPGLGFLDAAFAPGSAWAALTRPDVATARAVTLNRPKTIFYPIGWLAILAVPAWFLWLGVG